MQISLRSQMVAGVAALGATAVVATPVVHPDTLPSLQRVTTAFSLTQFVNPITALQEVAGLATDNLFSNLLTPDILIPERSDDFPFDLFYQSTFLGIVPDVAARLSFGVLNALVTNLSGYATAAIQGIGGLGFGLAASAFGLPLGAVGAIGALIGGDPEAALQILIDQVVTPLQTGVETALAAIGYIVDNVIINVQNVIAGFLPDFIGNLVGLATEVPAFLLGVAADTVSAVVAGISGGDVEGAWNAAVNGLLGVGGLLGWAQEFVIGGGYFEANGDELTVLIPSLRFVVNDGLLTLAQENDTGLGIFNPPWIGLPPNAAVEPAAAQAPEPDATAEPADVEAAALSGDADALAVADAAEAAEAVDAAAVADAAEAAEAVDAAEAAEAVDTAEAIAVADAAEAVAEEGPGAESEAGAAEPEAAGDSAGDED